MKYLIGLIVVSLLLSCLRENVNKQEVSNVNVINLIKNLDTAEKSSVLHARYLPEDLTSLVRKQFNLNSDIMTVDHYTLHYQTTDVYFGINKMEHLEIFFTRKFSKVSLVGTIEITRCYYKLSNRDWIKVNDFGVEEIEKAILNISLKPSY